MERNPVSWLTSDDQASHWPASNAGLDQLGFGERADLPVETEPCRLRCGVALGRGALGDADDHAVEVGDRREPAVAGDHDPLAVVEVGLQERGTLGAVASGSPRRVADQHVDLAGLQGGEPVGGLDVDELDGLGIAEDGGRDHSTEVGVEADMIALRCEHCESGQSVACAAANDAIGLHRVEQRLTGLHLFTRRRLVGRLRVSGGFGRRAVGCFVCRLAGCRAPVWSGAVSSAASSSLVHAAPTSANAARARERRVVLVRMCRLL